MNPPGEPDLRMELGSEKSEDKTETSSFATSNPFTGNKTQSQAASSASRPSSPGPETNSLVPDVARNAPSVDSFRTIGPSGDDELPFLEGWESYQSCNQSEDASLIVPDLPWIHSKAGLKLTEIQTRVYPWSENVKAELHFSQYLSVNFGKRPYVTAYFPFPPPDLLYWSCSVPEWFVPFVCVPMVGSSLVSIFM